MKNFLSTIITAVVTDGHRLSYNLRFSKLNRLAHATNFNKKIHNPTGSSNSADDTMVLIKVKWNKSSYQVDLDPEQGVETFKLQLFSLTNVPPERQKLMAKGVWPGILKDDANLTTYPIVDGFTVTLMGTANVIESNSFDVKFVEDMTSEERAKAGTELPSGLSNLGNTCYLNSTVQCLRFIDGFKAVLNGHPVAVQLHQLIDELDRSSQAVLPFHFLQILRNYFPQFAEMKQGRYMQQDADEFFGAIMSAANSQSPSSELMKTVGIELEETWSCTESTEEPVVQKKDTVFKLVCNIQGGAGSQTNIDHLIDGLKLSLEGSVEKFSDVLQHNSLWNKKQRISALPKVLCIQFMRFFWKAATDSRDSTGAKCKVLRVVSFTEILDIFDFCTEELQEVLRTARNRSRENGSENAATVESNSNNVYGLPSTFTGLYELCGVVTHQGRFADSGHYISYVRSQKDRSAWIKFDDEKVSETHIDEVLSLNGGADRHMAYFCFYRMKIQ